MVVGWVSGRGREQKEWRERDLGFVCKMRKYCFKTKLKKKVIEKRKEKNVSERMKESKFQEMMSQQKRKGRQKKEIPIKKVNF